MSDEPVLPGEPAGAPTIPPEAEPVLKLWVVLSRAHASILAHAATHVREHGLSLAEFAILEVLYHRGRMLLGEIQRRILVSSGGITFLVDRLAARKLVVRKECPEDRRARYVALTKEGARLIRALFPSHARALAHAMRGLSADEQRDAAALLKRLGRAASGDELPPPPGAIRRRPRKPARKEARSRSR